MARTRTPGATVRFGRWSRSLSVRFVTIMVCAEVAFALLLGTIVGLSGLRTAARERELALRDVSAVIASSLMPTVSDQDAAAVNAQLASIISTQRSFEIDYIAIEDGTGRLLAEAGSTISSEEAGGILGALTGSRTVQQPVVVRGVELGAVTIRFAPTEIDAALTQPLAAAGIVVALILLISVPWSAWLTLRGVVEPVRELRDSARLLAEGERDIKVFDGRADEIGELAATLEVMAAQIEDKEHRLLSSYRTLESAYRNEAAMKAEIEQLMETKSEFVAIASHELRNPLATARLYAEMLGSGTLGDLDADTGQAVEALMSSMRRLSSIVSDLMDAALVERGQLPLRFASVDIVELARRATSDARILATGRSVDVSMQSDVKNVTVWGDESRLWQVLDNLLSNAIKYSPAFGTVTVHVRTVDGDVLVDVIDQGRGIPPERRKEVFSLFGRVERGDDSEATGMGLGLAISARIAEAHGGSIDVRAGHPAGSVFTLTLPVEGRGRRPRGRTVSFERTGESR